MSRGWSSHASQISALIALLLGLVLLRGFAPVLGAAPAVHPDGLIQFDFESGGRQGWEVVEGDLGAFLCDRPVWYSGEPFGKQGERFLSTLETPAGPWDDRLTGVAESPVFVLSDAAISLHIGGGNHATVSLSLCQLDGTVVAEARGKNTNMMDAVEWNVPAAVGQPLFLRLADQHRTGYGWLIIDDIQLRGRIDPEATERRRQAARTRRRQQDLEEKLREARPQALRQLIDSLTVRFGSRFVGAQGLTRRLDAIESRLNSTPAPPPGDGRDSLEEQIRALDDLNALRQDVACAHPLVTAAPILYVNRNQYARDHHNTETIFHTGEPNRGSYQPGGALKLFDARTRTTRILVDPGPEGGVRDPEVHFSGAKVLFSMRRNRDENYHIYEVNADGSDLRQLTSEPQVCDIDPLYLPDGGIVFSSTREPKYCMCNMHIMANLYRMDGDGANIHQLGKSTLFEGHPTLLPDGRILYYRWEYVDRNYGDAQGLWTMNPDGTNPAVYWGNNTCSPGAVFDARALPGLQGAVCVFGSCHDRPWGALALLDRRLGLDATASFKLPVVRLWPENARELVGVGDWDSFLPVFPRYEDPYPLGASGAGGEDVTTFLVSRSVSSEGLDTQGNGTLEMGIFIVDLCGNEILLQRDPPGCFDPMPLAPRPRPPVIPSRRNFTDSTGTLLVQNVYQGTHLAGVEPGSVTALRIVESREKRFWTEGIWQTGMAPGSSLNRPAVGWIGFECKRILGTVPVEADGSAFFEAPADTFIYFQLLDRRGMMVASMRSGTVLQQGENTGCVGCHESRLSAPPAMASEQPLALERAPSRLLGWGGSDRPFSYARDVQPVFDRHCVRCHDFGKPAGETLNLAGDKTLFFNVSYQALFQGWRTDKALIDPLGAGPATILPAHSWGSSRSRLVRHLLAGHKDVELPPEDLERVIAWIDISAPYYPDYGCAYPDSLAGRSPLDNAQLRRLGELTGIDFTGLADCRTNPGAMITFDRPELSPCLARISDATSAPYQEALAMLRNGQDALAEHPRADMEGFTYCPRHQMRQDTYKRLHEDECRRRAALAAGLKIYD